MVASFVSIFATGATTSGAGVGVSSLSTSAFVVSLWSTVDGTVEWVSAMEAGSLSLLLLAAVDALVLEKPGGAEGVAVVSALETAWA